MSLRVLTLLVPLFIFFTQPVSAARFEKSIGAGIAYYSGNQSSALTPSISPHASFSANAIFSKRWNLVNRFDVGLISGGTNFAGQYGSYSGYVGSYELALRLNFAKEMVFPYLELGPVLAMYALTLGSTQSKNISENQTALKYGYAIGIGFDFVKAGQRGDGGGFGIGLTYFNMLKSPSMFEFPSAPMTAAGILAELRYLLPPAK